MPSTYAHYRFGADLLPELPLETQRIIHRFRQLYDVGLHGPDILSFNTTTIPNGTVRLCGKFHAQTGQVFFERVCRAVRMNPADGVRAYLYGVLAHYALDSISSSYATRMAEERKIPVAQVWAEFDRFLLEQDGKLPPHEYDTGRHLQLTPGECQTVALFYPNVSAGAIGKSVKNMATAAKAFSGTKGSRRRAMLNTARRVAPRMAELAIPLRPEHRLAPVDKGLLRLYDMAQERYPLLLEQLNSHLRRKIPLGPDFSKPFY